MDGQFDPYLRWLGIRDPQRPPNHYRLLGLELFENDPAVIAMAADRQMTHLRSLQAGKYAELSQRVLNELAAARICLLKVDKKAAYDRSLRSSMPPEVSRQHNSASKPAARSAPPIAAEIANAVPTGPAPGTLTGLQGSELDFLQPIQSSKPSRIPLSAVAKRNSAMPVVAGVIVIGLVSCVVLLWQINRQVPAVGTVAAKDQPSGHRSVVGDQPVIQAKVNATTNNENSVRQKSSAEPEVDSDKSQSPETEPSTATNVDTRPSPIAKRLNRSEPLLEDPTGESISQQFIGGLPIAMADLPSAELTSDFVPVSAKWAADAKSVDTRSPIPDKAAQVASLKEIQQLYKSDYASRKTDERVLFAKKLLQQGMEIKGDAAAQYVLWREAIDVAANVGDAETALIALSKIDETFAIKLTDEQVPLLTELARPGGRTIDGYRIWFTTVSTSIDKNLQIDEFDLAKRLTALGLSLSKRLQDQIRVGQFTARLRELEQLKKEYDKVKTFIKTLEESPDDLDANLAIGSYRCFYKGDFQRGLPLLAKGSDAELKKLSQSELDGFASPAAQADTADEWWDRGESRKDAAKYFLKSHATNLYRAAIPKLTGLNKARAETRVKEFDKEQLARGQIPASTIASVLTQSKWRLKMDEQPTAFDLQTQFLADGTMINNYFKKWEVRGNIVYCLEAFNPAFSGRIRLVSDSEFQLELSVSDKYTVSGVGTAIR